MEEGAFEERTAYVERDVPERVRIFTEALENGITWFDTTWKNEVFMLGKVLKETGCRDRIRVNGMVLGAFSGPPHFGISDEQYFNRYLEERLPHVGHFDSFMINAIEEKYDEARCGNLLTLLDGRRTAGDIGVVGFSCHDPFFARKVADRFPEFQAVMIPYSYHNRRFEKAFESYQGHASFIAMKTLVWLEYGIPFCAINSFHNFEERFGFEKRADIAVLAWRFVLGHPRISLLVSSVNTDEDARLLATAGEGGLSPEDEIVLGKYAEAVKRGSSRELFLSGLMTENLRMNYFACLNLARLENRLMPHTRLNEPDAARKIQEFGRTFHA